MVDAGAREVADPQKKFLRVQHYVRGVTDAWRQKSLRSKTWQRRQEPKRVLSRQMKLLQELYFMPEVKPQLH